jgi:dCMP deaminase
MRPSKDEVMLAVALALSTRATCRKRAVGCVLTDTAGHILSTGYNGVPHGMPHCIDTPCVGFGLPMGSDTCQAVHAEINAMLQCKDIDAIHTCYVTCRPCNNCLKTLMNTQCKRLVFFKSDLPPSPAEFQWLSVGHELFEIEEA